MEIRPSDQAIIQVLFPQSHQATPQVKALPGNQVATQVIIHQRKLVEAPPDIPLFPQSHQATTQVKIRPGNQATAQVKYHLKNQATAQVNIHLGDPAAMQVKSLLGNQVATQVIIRPRNLVEAPPEIQWDLPLNLLLQEIALKIKQACKML